MSRRLITTTARRLEAATSHTTPLASINGDDLPPVIQRYIQRHLNSPSPSSSITVPNPFIARQRGSRRSPLALNGESSSRSSARIPAAIPRRRQKQLAEYYSSDILPLSAKSTTTEAAAPQIQWSDPIFGERTITWSGSLPPSGRVGLYEGRKRMFKGHKHELRKVQRDKDTVDRLKGMEKRIDDWKKGKIDAKTSAKPALPF